MSLNLGSQQLSLTDMQTAYMESSSSSQTTLPVNLEPQPLSSSVNQYSDGCFLPSFNESVPVNLGTQQSSLSDRYQAHPIGQSSFPVNFGAFPLASRPSTSINLVQFEPQVTFPTQMSSYMGLQQLSANNRRPFMVHPSVDVHVSRSINMESQPSPLSRKQFAQVEASPKSLKAMSANQGPHLTLSTKKRPAQAEPVSKVQSESFESVRLKLRESLAAALGMVSQKQSKTEGPSNDDPTTPGQREPDTSQQELPSITATAASSETPLEMLTSDEQHQKCDGDQRSSIELGSNENRTGQQLALSGDVHEYKPNQAHITDGVSLSNNPLMQDELLHGNGLCWVFDVDAEKSEAMLNHGQKRPKLAEATGNTKGEAVEIPDDLATKIETELFRLFGGVNKKYKEKARSLLFNLKDRSNPELRERVVSGEIVPERLCSMTAEELASKELSQWRLAKAEELQQMIVLPDSDVDIRRLVKKTHKGEFQVEVEQDDNVSTEVGLDAGALSTYPSKSNKEARAIPTSVDKECALSKAEDSKEPDGVQLQEKIDSNGKDLSNNLDTLIHEKTDVMQEYMADELKDPTSLPSVVSVEEFMEALGKDLPFENMPNDTNQDQPNSDGSNVDTLKPEMVTVLDSLGPLSDPASNNSGQNQSTHGLTFSSDSADALPRHPTDVATIIESEMVDKHGDISLSSGSLHGKPGTNLAMNFGAAHAGLDTGFSDIVSKTENIWEGIVQLNISALATVIGFFKSGERTTTQEWPSFLEIKGRVRLDAFEKFLQELPLSRSRAIMIAQFCWKDGSPEIGRLHLCEAANTYVADERVGFAEPAPGVELYLCPPHQRTSEMLGRHLPKEHAEVLHSVTNGLIGVIVWRRPYINVSPKLPSQHKHKKHIGSRKQQNMDQNVPPMSFVHPTPLGPLPINPGPSHFEPVDDDVPPGFGPGAARDEDDLPEFDFSQNRSVASTHQPHQASGMGPLHKPALSHPSEHMRDLVHRYGQNVSARKPALEIEPWNDDDDDIPEWQPHIDRQRLPAPAPPPLSQLHGFRQPMHPFVANQQFVPMRPQQQPMHHALPQQLMPLAAPLPMSLQPPMGLMPPQQNMAPAWQPAPWWPSQGPNDRVSPINGPIRPCHFGGQPNSDGAQVYGMPGPMWNGMGWRPG